jgi:hypothetical protein
MAASGAAANRDRRPRWQESLDIVASLLVRYGCFHWRRIVSAGASISLSSVLILGAFSALSRRFRGAFAGLSAGAFRALLRCFWKPLSGAIRERAGSAADRDKIGHDLCKLQRCAITRTRGETVAHGEAVLVGRGGPREPR